MKPGHLKLEEFIRIISLEIIPEIGFLHIYLKNKRFKDLSAWGSWAISGTGLYNERVLQYLSYKALVKNTSYEIQMDKKIKGSEESDRPDFVLTEKGKNPIVIELKRWYSSSGNREIPSFKRDISRLKSKGADTSKYFVIFTFQREEDREGNFVLLEEKLDLKIQHKYGIKAFSTKAKSSIWFDIIGIDLSKK